MVRHCMSCSRMRLRREVLIIIWAWDRNAHHNRSLARWAYKLIIKRGKLKCSHLETLDSNVDPKRGRCLLNISKCLPTRVWQFYQTAITVSKGKQDLRLRTGLPLRPTFSWRTTLMPHLTVYWQSNSNFKLSKSKTSRNKFTQPIPTYNFSTSTIKRTLV
jgi:hypothetical protein